jgi:peptidoglycan/LPS O-acetylase OafA/YrhL
VSHTTLGGRFDPRNNSLNALRLLLATLVIVSHAGPLGGFGGNLPIGGVGLGGWAVAGFFAISGYLITSSRIRSSFVPYLSRRFLRIFPGLWACLLVVALVFAPLAALTRQGADGIGLSNLAEYVVTNGLFVHEQLGIGSTLHNVPFADSWNGSLWTLRYEFGCYLLLGAVLSLPAVRRKPERLAGLFVGCLLIVIAGYDLHMNVPAVVLVASYLATYFFAGALMYVYADRIRLSVPVLAVACAWLAVGTWSGYVFETTALPLALLLMALGATLPLQRIGSRNDISYGVYIYAFPVQQSLVLAGATALGFVPFILLSIAGTLPLAVASWCLVERRAMRLKRISFRSASPAALASSATSTTSG